MILNTGDSNVILNIIPYSDSATSIYVDVKEQKSTYNRIIDDITKHGWYIIYISL